MKRVVFPNGRHVFLTNLQLYTLCRRCRSERLFTDQILTPHGRKRVWRYAAFPVPDECSANCTRSKCRESSRDFKTACLFVERSSVRGVRNCIPSVVKNPICDWTVETKCTPLDPRNSRTNTRVYVN